MPAPPETPETATQSPSHSPVVTPLRVAVGVCLFLPFVALMWVSSYSRTEPTLGGLPFFYWYQMLWVLVSAVMTVVAYKLVQRDEARRRAAAGTGGAGAASAADGTEAADAADGSDADGGEDGAR
ncbi:DUF3311 domain-containing protein [Streptomyces marispadix]|uniref:DUF3311 domain-containing protein n=1 Tax=Streptomyces marispadix TaxID=2922868 RepID=UPI0027E391D6|nr:DUF3311 domain-containing protein [Streptomyces marispadix]